MAFYSKVKIVLIILLAILISFFTFNYLKSLKDDTTVVVAVQDIDEHLIIKPEMLKEISVSRRDKEVLEQNSVSSIKEAEGAVTKNKILKGRTINKTEDVITGTKETLIQNKVLNEKGEINQAYFITENKRIVTIRLDSQGAVSNKLNMGDWVDVIFTSAGDDGEKKYTRVLMNHVKINEVESLKGSGGGEAAQNISLLVTPEQAVQITYAKRNGVIDLALDPLKGDGNISYEVGQK